MASSETAELPVAEAAASRTLTEPAAAACSPMAYLDPDQIPDPTGRQDLHCTKILRDMAHDLKSPLTSILGFAELLSTEPGLSSFQQEGLESIMESGHHMFCLIDDTLGSCSTGSLQAELQFREFDPIELGQSVLDMFCGYQTATDPTLELDAPEDLPMVRGDATKTRRILTNLVENAVKFTPNGHVRLQVRLRARAHDIPTMLVLEVKDTGTGIPAQDLPHIFEPSFRGHDAHRRASRSSPWRRGGGQGLGLANCLELTRLMDGRIEVRSQVGAGSVFTVSIPVKVLQARP